jgi:hypothetical protein
MSVLVWKIQHSYSDSLKELPSKYVLLFLLALGPTQSPIQLVSGAPSLRANRPGREADYSLPSNNEVKKCVELYTLSNTPSWHGTQLKKRKDNFTLLYFTLL